MYARDSRAQNLKQCIVMKTSFETRVSQMGLPSFVDIDIFVLKYYFILFYDVHKENMFRTNLEDGREAPSKASYLNLSKSELTEFEITG